MGTSEKRPGSITFLLVGLVLMVMVSGLAFIPLFTCPNCHGVGHYRCKTPAEFPFARGDSWVICSHNQGRISAVQWIRLKLK